MGIKVTIPGIEFYNEETEEFTTTESRTVELTHCLSSLSKWESITHRSLLASSELTGDDMITYIRCMDLSESLTSEEVLRITSADQDRIAEYMADPHTATHIPDPPGCGKSDDKVTAELIYYWMVSFGIPFEAQTWPLRRLLALIKVCNVKNNPPKVSNKRAWYQERSALNAQRRAMYGGAG